MKTLSLLAKASIATLALFTGAIGMTQSAAGQDRRVWIANNCNQAMTEFYASNAGTGDWEEDILGSDVLMPGRRIRINMRDGSGYCIFDFKAVFRNGREIIRRNINVCRVDTWTTCPD